MEKQVVLVEKEKDMREPHERIFDIIIKQDEVTWQSIILDLVRTEQMDPWDVNVSLLAKKYIEMLKQLKETSLRVSGKVLLAAAIMLKIKSQRLTGEDLDNLDRLFNAVEEDSQIMDDSNDNFMEKLNEGIRPLIPRMPQPRKRKVSIYDLMTALEKALEVKQRRVLASVPPTNVEIPKRRMDISKVIRDVYGRIKSYFTAGNEKMTFSYLVPSQTKHDKIYTFIPLLHLTTQRKIDLAQPEHFGEIFITLANVEQEVAKELGKS